MEVPFEIAGRPCHISASIGIATAAQSGELDLVQAADMAMYAAKQSGGNRGMVFESSLHDRAARQFELNHELREALRANDQLDLVYQPLFGVTSGASHLVGFEALLRWRHPRHGWIAPEVTISVAEKSGLILQLSNWVLARAMRQGRVFQQARGSVDSALLLAVNVSPSQLVQPGFCSGLAEMLRDEGFPPAVLYLEVTESILTNTAVSDVLVDIRKLGVHAAIDDFGMGYSSLSLLRRLPVDVVKLDRSFLDDVEGNLLGASFVGAVIALAHTAGKSVVLEGIETQDQFDLASAAGADIVQGFLFAAPLSAKDAAELVARGEAHTPTLSGDR
jgi:EAL domain-containing protein (putative c-di-GMP-specific phosphodiesterase class I)